ncbi:CgeB family protein [Paenibacillus eucommiae]|uniref:Spore maturation protein CgeB n=1 Tax=Paenibacillus eucommiae TaxID=1355755 RepID=A0ABS4INN6_9BACL|nr:glycosyltransferase [Paenibacillus eucommiae]MBP1989183.1 spore maturation protein CgeB [Paenibacillus eucommiae]
MKKRRLRIVFLESHPMWKDGLPNGFRRLGHRVITCQPELRLRGMLKRFKPDMIITIGWTPANSTPEKQRLIAELVRHSGTLHVHWSTEDPGYTEEFSLPLIRRMKPDFVFTIHRPTVRLFNKRAIRAAHLDFGSDPAVHRPVAPASKYKAAAALVANGYAKLYGKKPDHYRFKSVRRLVNPFLHKNLKVDIYGRDWKRMRKILAKPVNSSEIHGYLPYNEAVKVYSSVQFVLGPQNAEDRLTQRTYEILASGGLLITDDTPEVRKWFRPGEDLLVTSSEQQTKALIDKYSKLPAECGRIRRNAVRAAKLHSYASRARYVLETLKSQGILSV